MSKTKTQMKNYQQFGQQNKKKKSKYRQIREEISQVRDVFENKPVIGSLIGSLRSDQKVSAGNQGLFDVGVVSRLEIGVGKKWKLLFEEES